MEAKKSGRKPVVGEIETFRFYGGTTVTGPVWRFVMDTPSRWKVEIHVEKIDGENAGGYMEACLGQLVMCEDYDLVE